MGKFGKLRMNDAPAFYREGMLVFQALPRQGLGQVIVDATNSSIAHVGILHKNTDDKWVVVEAIGSGGVQLPVDEFIARSPGNAWFKAIKGLTPDAARRMVNRAIELSVAPYDVAYQYDNPAIYCSELVASAAQYVGIDLFDVDIPAAWMDRSVASVQRYLRDVHSIYPGNNLPRQWRIIPPNTLFYSDKLQDPEGVAPESNKPHDGVQRNALYDTIPGTTVAEKYNYLRSAWGGRTFVINEIRDPQKGKQAVRFEISAEGQTYGLNLFRQFSEEAQLYAMIKKQGVRIVRPERENNRPHHGETGLLEKVRRAVKNRRGHL